MSFSMSCAALISPLVPHSYGEADTVSSAGYFGCQIFGNGLGLAHGKSFPSIFPSSIFDFCFLVRASHIMSRERLFFFSVGRKEGKTSLFLVICFSIKPWQPFLSVLAHWSPEKLHGLQQMPLSGWNCSAVLWQLLILFTLAEEVLFDPFKTAVQYQIPIPILQLKTNMESSLSNIHKVTATKLG